MIALTDEQLRILRAAHDGRLVFGRVGNIDRWYIEGEAMPIACERRRLIELRLLERPSVVPAGALTEQGARLLAEHEAAAEGVFV